MNQKYHTCPSRKLLKNGTQLNYTKCALPKRHEDKHDDKKGNTWDD